MINGGSIAQCGDVRGANMYVHMWCCRGMYCIYMTVGSLVTPLREGVIRWYIPEAVLVQSSKFIHRYHCCT